MKLGVNKEVCILRNVKVVSAEAQRLPQTT